MRRQVIDFKHRKAALQLCQLWMVSHIQSIKGMGFCPLFEEQVIRISGMPKEIIDQLANFFMLYFFRAEITTDPVILNQL